MNMLHIDGANKMIMAPIKRSTTKPKRKSSLGIKWKN